MMKIGVPKEVKNRENRVSMVPGGVQQLTAAGHKVYIQKDAGLGAGITNERYQASGATILEAAAEVWDIADMIIKVKEPIEQEFSFFKKDQILYTYLHLAAEETLTKELLSREVISIAYETIENANGSLPLLTPMSEVAGRMSVQVGALCLQKHRGGKGLLLGGVPGVKRGRVAIIGGGVVGINAAKMAVGLGARVTILDTNGARLAYLDDVFGNDIDTLMSNPENIRDAVSESDLVVGAVLIPGAKAPRLISRQLVAEMEPDSVIVDVAIDQGGCVETIRATTHDSPTYVSHGVVHYGVTNMPGDVPKTSTYALTNVTISHAIQIANQGAEKAMSQSPGLLRGLNTYRGQLTYEKVAHALGLPFEPLKVK